MCADRVTILKKHLVAKPVMSANSPLTTHVLDTARGSPAQSLPITLYVKQGEEWKQITKSQTNSDGRCPGLITQDQFLPGDYRIHFNTSLYFKSIGIKGFYPYVDVVFTIENPNQHYHVPLLLSPYGYSTYRGS